LGDLRVNIITVVLEETDCMEVDSKRLVLTMVYNIKNYLVFGLCPQSGILETRKHNVSETGSVSVLR
jgi:hypothetical protein